MEMPADDSKTAKKAKHQKTATYEDYNGPQKAALDRDAPLYRDLVTVQPSGTRMFGAYKKYHDQYQNFKGNSTDIWVSSYPKAGTTWTQELVWCIIFTLSHPRLTDVLNKRFPFFEWDSLFGEGFTLEALPEGDTNKKGAMWEILNNSLRNPRTIKTHLHIDLLPATVDEEKPKIVYVCRDPRDVCVSLFYHCIKLDGYTGDFESFVKLFLDDALPWSPYWSHVLGYWKVKDDTNVLFLSYEELKKDLQGCLKQVAEFLGVKREGLERGDLSPEEVQELEKHLSFSSMSKNPATNNEMLDSSAVTSEASKGIKFMRKGQVGDHKNHLTPEHLQLFKKWTIDALKNSDFPYYKDYD